MATHNYERVQAFEAGADLTDKQNYLVKMDTDDAVILAGAGENAIGVNVENAELAQTTGVVMEAGAIIEVVAGAAIAGGAKVASDAQGRVITATAAAHVLGVCKKSVAAADELAEIIWHPQGILAA